MSCRIGQVDGTSGEGAAHVTQAVHHDQELPTTYPPISTAATTLSPTELAAADNDCLALAHHGTHTLTDDIHGRDHFLPDYRRQ